MISIQKDHPGGNIEFVYHDTEKNIVYLRQELRDTSEWWFYWNFCAVSEDGGKYRFKFCNGDVVGRYGPAVKEGDGQWHYAEGTFLSHSLFEYTLKPGVKTYFSFALPYQQSDFEAFSNPIGLKPVYFTDTERGRKLNYYLMGNPELKDVILFTCRHHSCESVASYVLEGIIEAVGGELKPFFSQYKVIIIPFVDLDGVEDGDQGKSRLPHDHNRDYIATPHYAYTRALYKLLEEVNLVCGIDLHCPGKYGGIHDKPSLIEKAAPHCHSQQLYSDILEKEMENGAIQYFRRDNLRHGEHWNVGFPPQSAQYFIDKGARLSFSFEMPYFGDRDKPYTQEELRAFGKSMASALKKFFEYR